MTLDAYEAQQQTRLAQQRQRDNAAAAMARFRDAEAAKQLNGYREARDAWLQAHRCRQCGGALDKNGQCLDACRRLRRAAEWW